MSDGTVLLVEDNPRNLKLVRDVLEYAGFTVTVARRVRTALSEATRSLPDLILMDLQLPGINGDTALARLRADPRTAGIPVVALTAFAMTADREHGPGGRVRRLPREADQRARVPRPGARPPARRSAGRPT